MISSTHVGANSLAQHNQQFLLDLASFIINFIECINHIHPHVTHGALGRGDAQHRRTTLPYKTILIKLT